MNNILVHIADEADFSSMRNEWNALLSNTRCKSIFLTWDWLYSWWQHFKSPNSVLSIVCARDATRRLTGILPLYLELKGRDSKGGMLRFLGAGDGCSDFLDMIVAEGQEEEIAAHMLNYSLDRWSSCGWELTDILFGSKSLTLLESMLLERKISYFLRDGQICPFFELPDTVEGFMRSLKPNMRSNYKLSNNKIKRHFGKVFKAVETSGDFQSFLETLFKLHRDRFESKGDNSTFISERMWKFHLDVGRRFSDQGWLRFYMIEVGEKVVGSLYCFVFGGRTFYYQGGFDPNYEFLSIGNVLLGKGMEDSIENGIGVFEFLRGAEAYKWRWTNTYRKTVKLTIYPRNFFGTAKFRYDQLRRSAYHNVNMIRGKSKDGAIGDKQLVTNW